MEGKVCESPGCEQPAKLQCPTCIKLNIQVGTKKNWIEYCSLLAKSKSFPNIYSFN